MLKSLGKLKEGIIVKAENKLESEELNNVSGGMPGCGSADQTFHAAADKYHDKHTGTEAGVQGAATVAGVMGSVAWSDWPDAITSWLLGFDI